MTSAVVTLRQAFLDYFQSHHHTIVPSSPLVPANDPTLLFTNAGMVQFKETFLGLETRPYQQAATCQRCVRAGGKHNDLENVGYTARHHTFFEMLGNFSFGAYFKREAIAFAWTFLTEELAISPEKLWVTVYEEDDEAADIWLKSLKISPKRFSRCGTQDNFWVMGDTGPCGPCSEIFYDHGPTLAGSPPGGTEAGDRYVEIWNLVFMQFNRDAQGQLTPLPKPSVDTGMGLERLAAVMQGVHSNYDIDAFQTLIKATAELTTCRDLTNSSLRVIADHIRACTLLITDGVLPANEGRGYVLRRIIRRAIRHGHKLGLREPFFYRLVATLNDQMGIAYPELLSAQTIVEQVLEQEEERFDETLDRGLRILEEAITHLQGHIIPGELIFKLYDTYGFPTDLTADIARERNLTLDLTGFERCMEIQRKMSRDTGQFKLVDLSSGLASCTDYQSTFTGYEQTETPSTVVALFHDNQSIDILQAGQEGQVFLAETPFYAESGGQIGDKGILVQGNTVFAVADTQKVGQTSMHLGQLTAGALKVGDSLLATIDVQARQATARNHSATHLLHAALRQTLGEHITQKGSLVEPERLRFDFSHFEPLSPKILKTLEQLVNQQILFNLPVQTQIMSLEAAMQSGAVALFGEKYAEKVRVLSIGDFSTELCGGTHVKRSGDIGLFKIVTETGVAAGVRRIEAITGKYALTWVTILEDTLKQITGLLKTNHETVIERLIQVLEQTRQQEKNLVQLQTKLASSQGDDLTQQAVEIKGIKVLASRLEKVEVQQLRHLLDQLKDKLGTAVIVLATVKDGKISLIAGVTADLMKQLKANELVNYVAQQVGGKGGGRPDMAQAGGTDPTCLNEALASVKTWVTKHF